MDSQDIDNVTNIIIGLSVQVNNYPSLAGMEEPAPVSVSSTGPEVMISSVSMTSKNIQYHSLAIGAMVPSEVVTHITTALTLGCDMRCHPQYQIRGGKMAVLSKKSG